ncbi:MAG TPA: ABATE domain-containing protein, partial [Gemmatimonadales bacterium]|nr:ABATE domain-containing protein [Gemmatimonadales bacterium]
MNNPPSGVRTVANMALVGGRPAVDFVNTLSDRTVDPPRELLNSFDDLLVWAVRVELFGKSEARRLAASAREHPRKAAEALAHARALREALFGLFTAQIERRNPPAHALAVLNGILEEGLQKRRLESTDHGLCWTWAEKPSRLDWILWPLAWSAAELLSSSEVARLKECGQDDCRWIFLDLSKNRSRRWCTMEECGNRAKARRHYARGREARNEKR